MKLINQIKIIGVFIVIFGCLAVVCIPGTFIDETWIGLIGFIFAILTIVFVILFKIKTIEFIYKD